MIVVTGALGQLGTAFRGLLGDHDVEYLDEAELDFADLNAIPRVLGEIRPSLVINCAAFTAVDAAEENESLARVINATAVGELARVSASIGARFVTYSTDYVFDGTRVEGYVETDRPRPINAYGRTKLEGERLAAANHPDSLVIRTSWVLSGTHPNFAASMLKLIAAGPVKVVDDQRGRPTLVPDLARATMDAVDRGVTGTLHLANEGIITWYGLAREIATLAGLDEDRVTPCSTDEFPRPAPRPANSILISRRLESLGMAPLPSYRIGLPAVVAGLVDNVID